MISRLLVDLQADGRVSVGISPLADRACASLAMRWPLGQEMLEDLRWYLEDYLQTPFGVYEERGQQVSARLAPWGESIFSDVFGSGPARDAYREVLARNQPVEVVFSSASASLLALPWELARDPARSAPIALDLAGISRSLTAIGAAEAIEVPGGELRVLMVISRPAGPTDVPYRVIARRLLHQLEASQATVRLVVLRPPTLAALSAVLGAAAQAGEPFHVVHFDGHGAFDPGRLAAAPAEAMLAFELPGGGPDLVPASRVAQVLAAAQVPVVVLNACQSGRLGRDPGASVATRLLQAGIVSVVAMAYSVYTVAAAEFMTAFYERLFAGEFVGAAVTAGRLRMARQNLRPSPRGDMPLADWMVPVHYFSHDVRFPMASSAPEQDRNDSARLSRPHDVSPGEDHQPDDLASGSPFVGRDALFSRLEAAASAHQVVILHGPAGTGKTELARAFGQWWRDTDGVEDPAWVFWHTFTSAEAPFALDAVSAEIGMKLSGERFEVPSLAAVRDCLLSRRMLLIWDDFESVRSMADPPTEPGPSCEAGYRELRELIKHLDGKARGFLLIISRAPENWLGDDVSRIEVSGLSPREATEYAASLLAARPGAGPRRARRAFAELMDELAGNPLSMRLILPLLSTDDPEVLLDGLRGTVPIPATETGGSRTASLTASFTYSFKHLSPAVHRLLPAVCLFRRVADAGLLASMSQAEAAPVRFRATAEQWRSALDAAADVGLVTPLGNGRYQVHAAMTACLAAAWRRDDPARFAVMHDTATRALLTACALLGDQLVRQAFGSEAGPALEATTIHQHTFGHLLGYALDHQLWPEALAVAQPLHRLWEVGGKEEQAAAWGERVLRALADRGGPDQPCGSPAGALWLLFTWSAANRQLTRHQLDDAERAYRHLMTVLLAQPRSHLQRQHLAGGYHQLGMIAQERGRLGEARDNYLKAVAIRREIGERRQLGETYVHLGTVEEHSGNPRAARAWYGRALPIQREAGALPDLAVTYHQLGILAHRRGELAEAERWYLLGLRIRRDLGDRPGMAIACQQLGALALARGNLRSAETWYSRALAIEHELGHTAAVATSYHQLGVIAHRSGSLDDAERWYALSFRSATEAGDLVGAAPTASQLGMIAEEQGDLRAALEWTIRCVAAFDQFPHPQTEHAPERLARLTAQLGVPALESCWQGVTRAALPPAVRDFARSPRPPGSKDASGKHDGGPS